MFAQSQQGVALSATHSNTGNYAHIGTADAAVKATGTNGNAIEAHGDLYVDGAYKGGIGPNGAAPFPRPAYDSGWVSVPAGTYIDLDTGLAPPTYSNDNFFIVLRARLNYEWQPVNIGTNSNLVILTDNKIRVLNDTGVTWQIKLWVWYVK
jgi:hypothetical protein